MSKFNVCRFIADNAGLNGFEVLEKAYQQGREDTIADLFKALPDCDKIEIEHLITIMEQIKGEKNETVS